MNIEKDFEYWVDSLIEEGYDLSDYTWDEIYEEYLTEKGVILPGQSKASPLVKTLLSSPDSSKYKGGFRGVSFTKNTKTPPTQTEKGKQVPMPTAARPYGPSPDYTARASILRTRNSPVSASRAISASKTGVINVKSLSSGAQNVTIGRKYPAILKGKPVEVTYNVKGEREIKPKQEDFEYWVDSLFEEGYDLSNYTWEGLFEYFCENVLSEAKVNSGGSSLIGGYNLETTNQGMAGIPNEALLRKIGKGQPPAKPATATPANTSSPATAPPATPKGPTILASRNGVAGTMIKGDPSSWKAKEGGYSSSEMQRIRSVGTKRYETQRKAAVSSGNPEDFQSTTQTGLEVWSMANPKLAKANADRQLTRGTPLTSNPAVRPNFPEGVATKGPEVPETGLKSETGYAPLPSKGQGGPSAPAPAPAASASTQIRSGTRALSAADQKELLGRRRPLNASFDFSSPSKVASDMAYLYQSIYEGKKKVDQDMDGDNDFADVMIARMVAAGVPRAEAIRRVRNKEYNV